MPRENADFADSRFLANCGRVVVILPERLGDTLFHTPSLRLLKTARPAMAIEVIALSPLAAGVLANNPCIDAIHVDPDQATLQRIASRCDLALVVHNHDRARRCAQALAIRTITAPVFCDDWHQSVQALDFLQSQFHLPRAHAAARYELFPAAENFARVATLLTQAGVLASDILVGAHIGCHSIAKRGWKFWQPLAHPKVWPLANFVALARSLQENDHRLRLVLTGSKAEARLGKEFVRQSPAAINLIGQTTVLDLAALMARLRVFVTSDTGALHVACATGVDLVALFGPTSLQRTGPHPMQSNHLVLQARSIAAIGVDSVRDAVLQRALRSGQHTSSLTGSGCRSADTMTNAG